MREAQLEPLPKIESQAILKMGAAQLDCFVVDIKFEQFIVAVPEKPSESVDGAISHKQLSTASNVNRGSNSQIARDEKNSSQYPTVSSASLTKPVGTTANLLFSPIQQGARSEARRSGATADTGSHLTANSLTAMLESGRAGNSQPMSPKRVPWLFQPGGLDSRFPPQMTDAAWSDLREFEIGLRVLPKSDSEEAISGLVKLLNRAASTPYSGAAVPGSRNVFVMETKDANVYYRKGSGRIEVIRVLPAESSETGG
jgi:hypothetical protein